MQTPSGSVLKKVTAIEVYFSENLALGTGKIKIRQPRQDGKVGKVLDPETCNVKGPVLSIKVKASDMDVPGTYAVDIPAGAVREKRDGQELGNPVDALSGSDAIQFTYDHSDEIP